MYLYYHTTTRESYNRDKKLTATNGFSEYSFNLAGTEKEDISLSAENGVLEVKVKGEVVKSTFINPNFDNVDAEYKNGMLSVKFTKDKSPPKAIEIK